MILADNNLSAFFMKNLVACKYARIIVKYKWNCIFFSLWGVFMKQVPRSRPRKGSSVSRSNNRSATRNRISNDDFYGGDASSRGSSPYRYSKIHSVEPGQSSYENWKRQKTRKKPCLQTFCWITPGSIPSPPARSG